MINNVVALPPRASTQLTRETDQMARKLERIRELAEFALDPLGFVQMMFPWGSKDLAGYDGPDEWAVDILNQIGIKLRAGWSPDTAMAEAMDVIRMAVASGHGIGKSALVAWLIIWAMSTEQDCRAVITANTEKQLLTKTWPELAKWHRLFAYNDMFTCTATAYYSTQAGHDKTWRADAIPWSENNTEAFAGLHNQGKRILLIFDEASAIADKVWEVAEGALTDADTQIIWCAFGNPTQSTGRFFACFNRLKHRWYTKHVDSRKVKITNKVQIQQWIDDYGEDHDFVRVRVRGVFPRASSLQFIGHDIVRRAMSRKIEDIQVAGFPKILSVDVARHGDDQSVITKRKGTKVWPQLKLRINDTMALAEHVALTIEEWGPEYVFIDATGLGWAVVDRLNQLGYADRVIAVQVGESAADERKYSNKRAEMWGRCRDWLKEGGMLPDDDELETDLTGPQYGMDENGRYQLERKKDMKKRGLASPDCGDSLALGFSQIVTSKVVEEQSWRSRLRDHRRGSSRANRNPMTA